MGPSKLRQQANNIRQNAKANEKFIENAHKVHGKFYDYSQVNYVKSTTKVTIICTKHGPFNQTPSAHLGGQGCPVCGKEKARLKNERIRDQYGREFTQKAREIHGDKYDYSKIVYIGNRKKVTIICPEHGEFRQTPVKHLLSGQGCPKCAFIKRGLQARAVCAKTFVERAREVHGDKYSYDKVVYDKAQAKVTITCPKHGDFQQYAYNHLTGRGCPVCANHSQTKPEAEIIDALKSIDPSIEIQTGRRDVIPPLELDIYLPEHKLGIEYNGAYWHSDRFRDRMYHQKKKTMAVEKGLDLIHVSEFIWLSRKEQILSLILSRIQAGEKLHGRKTKVVELNPQVAKKFCEANHIQGYVNAGINLGLEDEDRRLVMVFTATRPRFDKTSDWEISRICSLTGTRVMGGASKLLSYFREKFTQPGETIISYAQYDWSNGGLYESLGFARDEKPTAPGYHWCHPGKGVMPRYRTQKHKLKDLLGEDFDDSLSERGNMEKVGYDKIYDAGCLIYRLKT